MEKKTGWNKKLEELRQARGMTQEAAAKLIGVPLGTYGRWERGYNKPLGIYRRTIAKVFNIDESEIFN